MSRPVNADPVATKRRLREAASQLFAESGPDGASVRKIAAKAGVSLGTVGLYFGNKQGLYEACIEAMYDELETLRSAFEGALEREVSPHVLADRLVRAGFRILRRRQLAVRLFMRTVVAQGEAEAQIRERRQRPLLDQLSADVAGYLGASPQAIRLPLQTLMASMGRYALSSERELRLMTGLDAEVDAETALEAVEDHLVRAAALLLELSPKTDGGRTQ